MHIDDGKSDVLILTSARTIGRQPSDALETPRHRGNVDEKGLERIFFDDGELRRAHDSALRRASLGNVKKSIAAQIVAAVLEAFAVYASATGPAFFPPGETGADFEDQ